MELILERKYPKAGYTIGRLLVDGKFFCNTLEPPVASEAEMRTAGLGKAITPGTYTLKLSWSQKFQEALPRLENVPGRLGILIHAGNNPLDSTGCILVGKNTQVGRVVDSRKTLATLISKIRQAISNGEEVGIEVKS